MRRTQAIWGLLLCAVLASAPVLAETASGPTVERSLPAEVDEQFSDPKPEERNEDKAYKGSDLDRPSSHKAILFSRLHFAQAVRCEDPHGLLTHGLRAPPA